jgi:ferredoxin-nitrite reductase
VGISFPGGRLRNGQLAVIGKIAARHAQPGLGEIRFTNKQNLILTHIPEAHLDVLKQDLSEAGFAYEASNFRKGCVSCTGIEFCNLAVAETKNRMISLVTQLETTSGWYRDKIRIHFSGCPSSCGQQQIADIGLRGARTKIDGKMVDAYDLFVGGRLGSRRRFNELLKGKILASEVHVAIDALLKYYDIHKQSTETFSDFCERLPRTELLSALPAGVSK